MLEKDLVYLCTFGLDDPLNKDVKESIDFIAHGHPDLKLRATTDSHHFQKNVNVRMVSGDHIETAKRVAF